MCLFIAADLSSSLDFNRRIKTRRYDEYLQNRRLRRMYCTNVVTRESNFQVTIFNDIRGVWRLKY